MVRFRTLAQARWWADVRWRIIFLGCGAVFSLVRCPAEVFPPTSGASFAAFSLTMPKE